MKSYRKYFITYTQVSFMVFGVFAVKETESLKNVFPNAEL